MHAQHGQATVAHTKLTFPDTVHMVLDAPWLNRANPGQFIMLRVHPGTDPLLRRPISICTPSPEGVELVFKVRGAGTRHMADWPVGHRIDCIGPLGNGFTLPPAGSQICLVAGGIGIAPLIGLARRILTDTAVTGICMFLGAGTQREIDALAPLVPDGCELHIATNDGTRGHCGPVTDALTARPGTQNATHLYGCGPIPMLKVLAELAYRRKQICQVSMEAHMACGVGACLGCTVPAHTPAGPAQVRVCADGPVFEAGLIFPHTQAATPHP